MDAERALAPQQVAERWGCCIEAVLARIRSGALRAVNVARGRKPRWRILPSALAKFEAEKAKPVAGSRRPHRERGEA